MCDQCDPLQRQDFPSWADYEQFSRALQAAQSLSKTGIVDGHPGEPKFWLFGLIGIGKKVAMQRGGEIWTCAACGQDWLLSEPDNSWRGFFKKHESIESDQSKSLGVTPMGPVYLGWVLFVVVATVLFVLLRGCFL